MPSEITQHLLEWSNGDGQALERLMPLVYGQLRLIASRQLQREADATLQPTELVHEAFLRLQQSHSAAFRNRAHFYGAVAEAMRRILIDLSRRRNTAKRAVTLVRIENPGSYPAKETETVLETLDRAVRKLSELDPLQAQIVHLRFYAGLSNTEVAEALGISESTVKRGWAIAKAWLTRECQGAD